MNTFLKMLHMGGYARYVWPAYGLVIFILALQLLLPWKRWQKIHKKQKMAADENE
jgi:heme exporter protein CcmD